MVLRDRLTAAFAGLLVFLIFAPAVASAAPPYASPTTIRSFGFEAGQDGFDVVEPIPLLFSPNAAAYWGPTTSVKRSGLSSLWCAGVDFGGSPLPFGSYPVDTRGRLRLSMTVLSDYYSSEFGFYYVMPSAGSADRFGFSVQRDVNGAPEPTSAFIDSQIPLSSNWIRRAYRFGSSPNEALSRKPLWAALWFIDSLEGDLGGATGQGPAIDDVSITGYRFGPVRQLQAGPSEETTGVLLTWAAPYRSAYETVEETRALTYRVWRSVADKDSWTEITPAEPLSATSLIDTTAPSGIAHDYVVQAWEPAPGTGHGPQPAAATFPWKPGFSLTSKSVTLGSYGSAYTFSGRLLVKGAPLAGRRVVLQASTGTTAGLRDTSLVATTSATGSFSFRVTPRTATYYRVRYAGEPGSIVAATSAYVRVVPRALVTTPNAPRTMYRSRTYAVTGYLRPRHSSGSVRIYRERKTASGWRSYGYVTARLSYGTSTASKYTGYVRLPYRGQWRLRAYHADSGHAASRSSSYDYVTVR